MHAEITQVLLLVAGLGLGFANALASSGSALSLPILLALGLGPELANGTNRVAVLVGALAAVSSFARARLIQWRIVIPLMASAAVGALIGVRISEVLSPSSMHLAIVAAECVALVLLVIRPSRWVNATGDNPHAGPLQLVLVFVIGIWTGFIVLDGGTYLLLLLVFSVGFNVLGANAAKSAIMATIAAVTLPVLAFGNHIDWGAAGVMSVGSLAGGLLAARVAMIPGAAQWVYRLIVAILVGELAHLAFGGLRP
ncbi:MAG: sulfite exporter TauE/SafE family protein [Mycobacterium sp.]|nr:sulfite exporter TauE/SafE family protein [Mycobacterium sp.]